jgi:hypothetical protein
VAGQVGRSAGPQSERQKERAAQVGRAQGRPWASCGCGLNSFFCFSFTDTVLLFFAQILGKFHIVFSIQIFPTKILFREFKSYRIFSAKFKVNEFLFMFPLQIVKINCLNAIKW